MKATGIIRRIDDLGRVVIPREIRRSIGIREGEPFEIFIEGKDTICFRKYGTNLSSEIDHLMDTIETCVDDCGKMAQIKKLLVEVQKLVGSES